VPKIGVMRIEIKHERWKCIGCGSCVAVDPDRWEMNDDNIADLKDCPKQETPEGILEVKEFDDLGESEEAADLCPVECIHIKKLD
jgi:ferredoxin